MSDLQWNEEKNEYRIFIPGMADFIAFPVMTKKAQDALRAQGVPEGDIPELSADWIRQSKIERIRRMKSQYSPVPDKLKWIPQVINYLDDAQDILITALTLGKWLMPRVLGRFIPYVGWALLLNDMLNLGTALMGVTMTGPTGKRLARAGIQALIGNRMRRIKYASAWMKEPIKWLPFALQAGQAAETTTGYGLRLGPLMGAVSGTFWGAIRMNQGAKVRVIGPPSTDPIMKAARFLSQNYMTTVLESEISQEDKELIIVAEALSVRMMQDTTPGNVLMDGEELTDEEWADVYANPANILNKRVTDLSTTEVPEFVPWDDLSREALDSEGINPDGEFRLFTKVAAATPTYLDTVYNAGYNQRRWEAWQAVALQYQDNGGVMQMINAQAGEDAWDFFTGQPETVVDVWDRLNIVLSKAIEFGVYPVNGTLFWRVRWWLTETRNRVNWFMGEQPTRELLITVALETMGAWQDSPPSDWYAMGIRSTKTFTNYSYWQTPPAVEQEPQAEPIGPIY